MDLEVDDEAYELAMIDYQMTEIARLNEVLRRHGIDDVAARRRICAEFADASGSFLDRGWMQRGGDGPRLWPLLAFATRTLDADEGLGDAESLLLPSYASNFHEYVDGAVDSYFDEQSEQIGDLETGYV